MAFNWTKDNINKLKNLWKKGTIVRDIAKEMGGISRNAVIGKAYRLGLSTKRKKSGNFVEESPMGNAVYRAMIRLTAASESPSFSSEKLCQWPFGDPNNEDFRFCHKDTVAGRPYCKKHCDMAYKKNPHS